MLHDNPNAFTANPLDKAGVQRKDKDWLAAQARKPEARLLLFYRGELLIDRQPTTSQIQWLAMDALRTLPMDRETVLLGLWDGAPIYAVDASHAEKPPFADIASYANLRNAAPFLPPQELAVAGQGMWLLNWHRQHRFCAYEGDRTVSAEGGFKRINERTGAEHFPRTDPVAIVLPIHGDEICLGRSPHFPAGFMSCFAGYMEPGETLEQCAERELFEEVGLQATSMGYIFSQPWPFPHSLMMGFFAEVASKDLTLDPTEIEEARWFSRKEAELVMNGEHAILCPPRQAIAHQLIKLWLERTA
ncbi:NAD(+) diphosphatase [Parvularcula lutaonensis]|uniref:NAD(+) diphosphatase n=1 Tax=Parvularcula lutaonensis TaxID=491923 RepID=A0ABV7M9I8_9PROT|nr:NAD(+) diphosphatase [Parvularcula lutaonensis]GGY46906.1 NADH pyrophosphatase [Parvularcula lutaonensis]